MFILRLGKLIMSELEMVLRRCQPPINYCRQLIIARVVFTGGKLTAGVMESMKI